MADQAKGKGIAPKRASNPADLGQSSRPLPPIRTLSEDKEDSEDYSEVIEVLKQHIKSYKRVIASQSSDIKTLLLSLNTLKASVEDSVSAIKNISSTLASLTNSSNAVAATTGKTSYSPRFDPFSGTMDLDSPLHPPRKEPYLGPAVNSATSNLDPPIDIGSKEGFKDTITSSIVKELSKKAYTIPDDKESRNPAIEAYRAAYVANSSNSTPNSNSNPSKKGKNKKKGSYNLAIEEEEESDSSSNSRYKKRKDFKGKGLKTSSNNKAKYKDNQPRRRLRDPALYNSWLYNMGSIDHISNSKERFTTFMPNTGQLRPINTGNGPISPAGIGSITLEVLSRKAPYTYTKLVLDNVLYLPNIDINIISGVRHYDSGGCLIQETLYGGDRRCIAVLDFKKSGFFLDVKGSSKPILHANFAFPLGLTSYNTTKSIELQCNKIVVEIPSNSIRKEDYSPIIEDAIVSEVIEPNKRYKLRNSLAKGTTLEGKGPSLRGKRPCRPLAKRGIKFSTSAPYIHEQNGLVERSVRVILDLNSTAITNKETTPFQALFNELEPGIPHIPNLERYRAIGARGEAIIPLEKRSKPLKFTFRTEECKLLAVLGSKTYLVYIPSRRAVLKTSTIKFIKDNTVLSQPTNNTALEGELVDLDLDLEGAVSPDPSNLNTEKPISIEIGPSKLEPYKSSSNSELDEPLPDKPINPVIVESTRPTISIRKPELPEAFPQTIEPIFAPKPIEVIAPNQPITNEPLNNSNLISEGDKMQLDYYKLLAKTSSYILSLLPSNRKLITYRNVLKVKKDAKNRPIKYKSRLVARGFIQVEGLDYTITYASTSILPTWRILLAIGVFYNAKTCYFIVTYIDDCLFIGPDIGYITDLKKQLNKYIEEAVSRFNLADSKPISIPLQPGLVNQLQLEEDITSHLYNSTEIKLYQSLVGTAIYIMLLTRYLNSTKDYSICFSYNGNIVANLGPKLSNSSNTTTKLSRDFYSKEGPRPLTTTSTTIVDSRNSKGSSRTSIINSSLVPIGFSDSDFAGDKATSKSTYGYLYKLAGGPISWKTKRATTIALSTLEAETDGLTEAIREVQWIIGLFSELYRPIDHPITLYGDNQGSITVANDPALYARTKHTLLKFQYVREQVKAKIVTIIYLNTNLLSGS
ncbi:hypothetical protein P8C59_005448 [Phyllachora maydis]|uniref:Reverse transcriptase Ty1/copia-type domain-containing protein n=1 Tax=Phyllachora maydis TaxID=1825666 RepID=A0AAD9I4Q2_9PEZI|nr:hypothetical protein P8C59_005448 [Phyllachora maydis]